MFSQVRCTECMYEQTPEPYGPTNYVLSTNATELDSTETWVNSLSKHYYSEMS
jgi:hypothetical protein